MKILFACIGLAVSLSLHAQKEISLQSPDGNIRSTIVVADELTYSVSCGEKVVLAPSAIGVSLEQGTEWGQKAKLQGVTRRTVNQSVASPLYRNTQIRDFYNELVLRFKGNWNVEFRAYNDGVAYRLVNRNKAPFRIANEKVEYRFPEDWTASVPYVKKGKDGDYPSQFFNSFENTYTTAKLSELNKKRLMFLPLVVDAGDGVKVCISESHLENYPGLYLSAEEGTSQLTGRFAPYPKRVEQGGHNRLQMVVKETEDYIAQVEGPRTLPWRMCVVTTSDQALASTEMSYLLASPSRVSDISWIKPGKVAWDWWNDWNLDGVSFKTGVNMPTYKAYIDFASAHGIEYVILDEGWAVNLQADLMQVVPELNLEELVKYATEKQVGIILWAGYYAFDRDMEQVCRHYAEMGVKGFKVDFMDRDDQQMTAFNYRAAEMCAKYHLVLDLHGTHKPAGLHRTYPNVLNFEGVHGLEQMKWSPASVDQVKYDAMIPFIRQVAGPMDYTQGAMRNATKENYFPCNNEPMSLGTRCHQLALYLILDSPFNMLCDTPSNYLREMACTRFIADVPTVWDETRVLSGKMGEYVVFARRKGNAWYVGGISDWTPRDLEVDCSFLDEAPYQATLFRDGVNADRVARDYEQVQQQVNRGSKLKIHLAPGGGFAMKLTR